jgi:2-hydroxychromene-2-carboxylate isomerase
MPACPFPCSISGSILPRSDAIKARLRTQTEEAQRLGVFGAPSFTTADGELFWGNDRLEPALRWAKAAATRG